MLLAIGFGKLVGFGFHSVENGLLRCLVSWGETCQWLIPNLKHVNIEPMPRRKDGGTMRAVKSLLAIVGWLILYAIPLFRWKPVDCYSS